MYIYYNHAMCIFTFYRDVMSFDYSDIFDMN